MSLLPSTEYIYMPHIGRVICYSEVLPWPWYIGIMMKEYQPNTVFAYIPRADSANFILLEH